MNVTVRVVQEGLDADGIEASWRVDAMGTATTGIPSIIAVSSASGHVGVFFIIVYVLCKAKYVFDFS